MSITQVTFADRKRSVRGLPYIRPESDPNLKNETLYKITVEVENFTGRLYIETSGLSSPSNIDWKPIVPSGMSGSYLQFPRSGGALTGETTTYVFYLNRTFRLMRFRIDRDYLNLSETLTDDELEDYGRVVGATTLPITLEEISRRLNRQDVVSLRDVMGTDGNPDLDSIVDCSDYIDTWLATAEFLNRPAVAEAGVYRCTRGFIRPPGVIMRGAGSPKLAPFPLSSDDKKFLRAGNNPATGKPYKAQLPGTTFLFGGTPTALFTTPRSDRFASGTYAVLFDDSDRPGSAEGFAVVMDMDVFNNAGSLTITSTDNAARQYKFGMVFKQSSRGRNTDLTSFGYWPGAGMVVYGSNPDDTSFHNVTSNGDIGCAEIGNGTNGLSGTNYYGCHFHSMDHHGRGQTDSGRVWGTTAYYRDGQTSNGGINGSYHHGGTIRTYCDYPFKLNWANNTVFFGVKFEMPDTSETGATMSIFGATTNTGAVAIYNPRENDGDAVLYGELRSNAASFLLSQGSSNPVQNIEWWRKGRMVRIGTAGSGDNIDSFLQLARSSNGGANDGWTIRRDDDVSDNLDFRFNNTSLGYLDSVNNVWAPDEMRATWLNLGVRKPKTIVSGAFTATGSHISIDTEAAAPTDDLDTIDGGAEGRLLIIRNTSSARAVVVKDGTGNLKLRGDCRLVNTQDTLVLYYTAGNVWNEISRSINSGPFLGSESEVPILWGTVDANNSGDQQLTARGGVTVWKPTRISIENASVSLSSMSGTLALRTGTGGGGTAILSAQSLTSLTTNLKAIEPALATNDRRANTTMYARLSSAFGSAGTFEVVVYGIQRS